MKLQSIDDLVDHPALGAHRKPDEIEVSARHRPHGLAIGGVVRGLEHFLGIDGRRDIARQRAVERARQRGAVGAVDQDRLADQRQILRPRGVAIGLADAFGEFGGDAAAEEGGDVELLPRFQIGPDHDRDLGVEVHGGPQCHSGARHFGASYGAQLLT